MAKKISVKKYVGVYYTESTTRRWRERPDRIYWVSFRDSVSGKLRWERCGWASEGWTPESAQKRRHELLEEDRAGDYKPKSQRRSEQVLFSQLMEEKYLPWADSTKKRPRDDRSRYAKWLKPYLGKKTLKEISPLDLEKIKKQMRDQGMADATIRHVLCIVRHGFNKAIEWNLWDGSNPCSRVRFPRINNARERFLSPEEASQLLTELHRRSPLVASMAILSLYGGLRLGEIFNLRWKDVDRVNRIIQILDSKSGEARPAFITAPIESVLEELVPGEPEDYLFKSRKGTKISGLSKSFDRAVEVLGLNAGITDRRQRVTFHTLRHTFASWGVMSGAPIYVMSKCLGHKTASMTERYAHLAPESQREVFSAVAAHFSSDPGNGHLARKTLDQDEAC